MTGPELAYIFEPTQDGEYTLTLTGLTDDLDLIVLDGDDCDAASCLDASWNVSTSDEEVVLQAASGDLFRVIVDGWDGSVSDFLLELSCSVSGDDDDSAADDDDSAADDDDSASMDSDLDGWDDGEDCDDNDPLVHPGAVETCDAVDNDCSGGIDEGGICPGCFQGEYDGHTYQFCDGTGGLIWTEARDWCVVNGYYLVTIGDAGENAFLAGTAIGAGFGEVWIGYNDRGWGNEGSFYWTGASGTGYENWDVGEPNNAGNEDCVDLVGGVGGLWNDMSCSSARSWVCEVDL